LVQVPTIEAEASEESARVCVSKRDEAYERIKARTDDEETAAKLLVEGGPVVLEVLPRDVSSC
jgi:hypothetical protein